MELRTSDNPAVILTCFGANMETVLMKPATAAAPPLSRDISTNSNLVCEKVKRTRLESSPKNTSHMARALDISTTGIIGDALANEE
jgi:hypothetical protein